MLALLPVLQRGGWARAQRTTGTKNRRAHGNQRATGHGSGAGLPLANFFLRQLSEQGPSAPSTALAATWSLPTSKERKQHEQGLDFDSMRAWTRARTMNAKRKAEKSWPTGRASVAFSCSSFDQTLKPLGGAISASFSLYSCGTGRDVSSLFL